MCLHLFMEIQNLAVALDWHHPCGIKEVALSQFVVNG